MPANLAIMAREAIAIGPIGRRLAGNILALRKARGLNQPQLARRMQDQGRAVHATVVSKVEQLDRRVDVDDLVALAIALGVSPNRLLLPPAADDSAVELASELTVAASEAWPWARGVKPLNADLERAARDGEAARIARWEQFVRENAPRGSGADEQFDSVLFHGGDREHAARNALGTFRTLLMAGLTPDALHKLVDAAAAINGHGRTVQQSVVAAIVTSPKGVLVGRRRDGKPPWTFIAGEVEPGESPEDAAVREVKEETGLLIRAGEIIGERDHPATGRHMIYMAGHPTHGTKVFVGDEAELAEVRWVSLAEADELLPGMFEPVRAYLERTLVPQEGEGRKR